MKTPVIILLSFAFQHAWSQPPDWSVEWGNHYARAMASWSTIVALSAFNYSAVDGSFRITSVPGDYFWSNGWSWGNAAVKAEGKGSRVTISVRHGKLKLNSVETAGVGRTQISEPLTLGEEETREFVVSSR